MRLLLPLACLLILPGVSLSSDLSELFARVDPSVVVLHTYSDEPIPGKPGQTGTAQGLGSGVIISDDGKLVTAAHVVHSVDTVHVELVDGKKVIGRVLSSEPAADIALLQMDPLPDHFVVAELGDSDQVKVGQEVFAIGAPYGLAHTLSGGHISARHARGKADNPFFRGEFLQTDAAINRGNSGGPVFDLAGRVIGIVSYIESKSGGSEGLGFVVTANTVRDLMLLGTRFWSGLESISVTRALARAINYPKDYGMLVQRISESSPAAKAGIRGGDLPVKIGKEDVLLGGDIVVDVLDVPLDGTARIEEIRGKIGRLTDGASIKVRVFRAGVFLDLNITKPIAGQ